MSVSIDDIDRWFVNHTPEEIDAAMARAGLVRCKSCAERDRLQAQLAELQRIITEWENACADCANTGPYGELVAEYRKVCAQVAQMREVLQPILNEIDQRGQLVYPSRVTQAFKDRYGDMIRAALQSTGEDYHHPADVQRIAELEGIIAGYKAAQEIELDAIRNAMNAKHQFHSAALRNEGERAIVGDAVKVFQATNEAAEGYARLPDGLTFTVEHITRDGKRMYLEGTYEGTPLRVWAASCYLTD